MTAIDPQALRDLAASPKMCGKNSALIAAADTIDALRRRPTEWQADQLAARITAREQEREQARAEVARLRDALTEIDRLRKEVDHQRGIAAQLRDMREEDAEQARAEVARLRAALVEIASTGTLSACTAAKYHAIARAALEEGT